MNPGLSSRQTPFLIQVRLHFPEGGAGNPDWLDPSGSSSSGSGEGRELLVIFSVRGFEEEGIWGLAEFPGSLEAPGSGLPTQFLLELQMAAVSPSAKGWFSFW